MLGLKLNEHEHNEHNFHPLEAVCRDSDTQLQVDEKKI